MINALLETLSQIKAHLEENKPSLYGLNGLTKKFVTAEPDFQPVITTMPPKAILPLPINNVIETKKEIAPLLNERLPKEAIVKEPAKSPPSAIAQKTSPPLKPLKVDQEMDSLSDMAAFFHRAFPNIFVHPDIPNDRKAIAIKTGWKIKSRLIDVPIFASKELTPFLPFLHNIAKAIDVSFAPSRVIQIDAVEKKDVWDTLLDPHYIKLVICPDVLLWSSKALIKHYEQQPLKSIQKLGSIDLILLSDLSLYMKDPMLKQALWNMLSQYFHTLPK